MNAVECIDTPLGHLQVRADAAGLTHVQFVEDACNETVRNGHSERAVAQLRAYFAGDLRAFDVPLNPGGTPFQRAVWQQLLGIPFAQTCSYLAVATALNKPAAVRAVGRANGANPLAIVVPCHRVIGRDGALTGYAGGLSRKQWLLRHELHSASAPWTLTSPDGHG